MAKKRNIIVGQSGGPTSVINSSLAGVYKNAVERGFDKVYGMLHGIQGLLDEQYIDLSTQIHSELDIELLKRTPSAFPGFRRETFSKVYSVSVILLICRITYCPYCLLRTYRRACPPAFPRVKACPP